jgi:hypothetical protein
MLDLSYFQNSGNVNTQTFTNAGSWVTWVKPRGAKFVNILCLGSGGGGGGGNTGTGASGGAGACASHVKAVYQASVLPDILYVQTGIGGTGGAGGAASGSGASGQLSYITLIPDTSSISNIVCISGATVAGGGTVGTTTGVGGTVPTVATTTNAVFLNLATFTAGVGLVGQAGSTLLPTNVSASLFVSSGTVGGGNTTAATARNGASIIGTDILPTLPGGAGTAVASAVGGNGSNGIIIYKPVLMFYGGTGGGNSKGTGGIAGNGGNGAYGCGGGSGGAGTASGGAGGKGGDGLIIITTSF